MLSEDVVDDFWILLRLLDGLLLRVILTMSLALPISLDIISAYCSFKGEARFLRYTSINSSHSHTVFLSDPSPLKTGGSFTSDCRTNFAPVKLR